MRISDWSSDVCSSDLCGFAHHGGSGDDFGCKEKSERSGASYEIRAHQPHHGLTRYAKGQRDSSLSRDDPESNLTHLPCYRRIVFFSEITRNDGPKNRVKTRSEEHTSELQSLMRISYAVFVLKK